MLKRLLLSIALLISLSAGAQNYVFQEGMIAGIQPEGWLKEALHRQQTGLTGHPEALSYPYNTCLWAGYIPRIRQQYDSEWWRYEQTAYFTDGMLRLGYLIGDQDMISRGEEGVRYTMEHVQSNGRLGDYRLESLWPMCVFFRAMKAEYEMTGDRAIVDALEKNYLSLSLEDLLGGHRHILNIEGMLWTYGITGNGQLLDLAEQAFNHGGFALDANQINSESYIHMHGVTYSEQLKLPMMLYIYTGKQEYLDLAIKAERQLERNHMLPDGLFTAAEHTLGNDIDIAHETCNISDYTWTLGYFLQGTGDAEWADRIERVIFNAGMGSITKDFKALQYFSSVNQIIATGSSDNNEFKRGSTWMAYRPTHETECCAGNVSRWMPNFAFRLWMRGAGVEAKGVCGGKDGIVAAMYAPSKVSFKAGDTDVTIIEDTYYPFDSEVSFRFETSAAVKLPFTFRVPGWARGCQVKINGKKASVEALPGTFVTLDRCFQNGDILTVNFDMAPQVVEAADGQGQYVECGPLLYAYAIPETWTEDTEIHKNLNGKASANPDFKCWNITPAGKWNYGMAAAAKEAQSGSAVRASQKGTAAAKPCNLKLKVDRKLLESGAYPFDAQGNPLSIQVAVEEIEWNLIEGARNPDTPKGDDVHPTGPKAKITLVPYGTTQLRVTVFPTVQ